MQTPERRARVASGPKMLSKSRFIRTVAKNNPWSGDRDYEILIVTMRSYRSSRETAAAVARHQDVETCDNARMPLIDTPG